MQQVFDECEGGTLTFVCVGWETAPRHNKVFTGNPEATPGIAGMFKQPSASGHDSVYGV